MELLNAEAHRSLTIQAARGHGRHFVQVVPSELARVAMRAPIVLTKHPETGHFYLGAIYGFSPGENLLLGADGMLDGVVPLDWEREGFFVEGDAIAIDPVNPRFGGDGQRLFETGGEPADPLRRIQRAMAALHSGLGESEALINALLAAKLVEPFDVSLSFDDGETVRLEGLYTISRDALADLSDAELGQMFRAGHLQLALAIAESLNQISLLARRRNDRLLAR